LHLVGSRRETASRGYNNLVRFRFLVSVVLLTAASAVAQNSSANNSASQSSSSGNSSNQPQKPAPPDQNPAPSNKDTSSQSAPAQSQPPSDQSSNNNPKNDQTPSFDPPSSIDTRIDLTAPRDDAKNHPSSANAVSGLVSDDSNETGIQEFHPWNPLKAEKDVEVGDFYFRRKNYKAALDRYKEALYYQNNYAIASYRLAVCEEKLGNKAEAARNYQQYLNILPEGPLAKDAHASLNRLAQAFK
jgi:tetratricopeptide (TPR) repeat protein